MRHATFPPTYVLLSPLEWLLEKLKAFSEAKRKKTDIRELFKRQEEEKDTEQASQEPSQAEDQADQPEGAQGEQTCQDTSQGEQDTNQGGEIIYGETETVKLIDW